MIGVRNRDHRRRRLHTRCQGHGTLEQFPDPLPVPDPAEAELHERETHGQVGKGPGDLLVVRHIAQRRAQTLSRAGTAARIARSAAGETGAIEPR